MRYHLYHLYNSFFVLDAKSFKSSIIMVNINAGDSTSKPHRFDERQTMGGLSSSQVPDRNWFDMGVSSITNTSSRWYFMIWNIIHLLWRRYWWSPKCSHPAPLLLVGIEPPRTGSSCYFSLLMEVIPFYCWITNSNENVESMPEAKLSNSIISSSVFVILRCNWRVSLINILV